MLTELSDWLIKQCKFAPELSEKIYNQLIENGIYTSNDLKLIDEYSPTWIDVIEMPKLTRMLIRLHIKKIGRLELITLKPKDVENLMSKLYNGDYVETMKIKLISGLELCCVDHIDILHQYGVTSCIHALSLLTFIKEWKKYGIPMSLIYHSDIIYRSEQNNNVAVSSSSAVNQNHHILPQHIATGTVATKVSNNECDGGDYCYNVTDERPDPHSRNYPLHHMSLQDHSYHSVFTRSPLDDAAMDHHLDLGMDMNEYDDMNYDNDCLLNETFHEYSNYYRYDDDDRTATGSTCSDSSLELPNHPSSNPDIATPSQRKRVGGRALIVGDNTSNIIHRRDDYMMTISQYSNNNNRYINNRAKLNMRPPQRSNTDTNSNNINQRSTRNNSKIQINSPTGYNTRKYVMEQQSKLSLGDIASNKGGGGVYNSRKRKIQCKNFDRNNTTTTTANNSTSSNKNNSSGKNTSATTVSNKRPRKGQPKYNFREACEIIKNSNDIKVLNSVLKYIIHIINPISSFSYIKQSSNKKNKQTMAINNSSTNYMNDHEDNAAVNVRDISRDNIDVFVNTKTFLKLFQIIHKHASYDDPLLIHFSLAAINAVIARDDATQELMLLFQHKNLLQDVIRFCSSDNQDIRLQSLSIIGDCGLKDNVNDHNNINDYDYDDYCFKQKILETGVLTRIIESYEDISKFGNKAHSSTSKASTMKHVKNAYSMVLYQLCSECNVEQFDILKQCLPLLIKLITDENVYSNTIVDALTALSFLILNNNSMNIQILIDMNIISILKHLFQDSSVLTVKWHVINCFMNLACTIKCGMHQQRRELYVLIDLLLSNDSFSMIGANSKIQSASLHCISSLLIYEEKECVIALEVLEKLFTHRSQIISTLITYIRNFRYQFLVSEFTIMKYACKCIFQACMISKKEHAITLASKGVFFALFKIILIRHELNEDLKLNAIKSLKQLINLFIKYNITSDPIFQDMIHNFHIFKSWQIIKKIAQGQSYEYEEILAWKYLDPTLILESEPICVDDWSLDLRDACTELISISTYFRTDQSSPICNSLKCNY